jgi:hypothetical protein
MGDHLQRGPRTARACGRSSGPARPAAAATRRRLLPSACAVLAVASLSALPLAASIPFWWGQRAGQAAEAKAWGKGTGGVPTQEELHSVFPPIPINLSVTPVVLVPGIGGSVMAEASSGLLVWIRLYEATYYFQRYMWGRYNETTRTMDPVTKASPSVGPVTSGFGLDGIRNLDPTVHWPIYNYVTYFDTIISTLESQGWLHGKTLFGAPWDWRQVSCLAMRARPQGREQGDGCHLRSL